MSGVSGVSGVRALRLALTEHRFYKYRGCAPHPDDGSRAAGDPSLGVDAWCSPNVEGGESQRERAAREAAVKGVCGRCPVMAQCAAYASSVTAEGRLAEPDGVWGGRTALERHRELIRARCAEDLVPAPDRLFRTPQKQAVLAALAVCWEPCEVAWRAGMPDVRTANWQRSQLVRLLGLPKSASRMRVLEAARVRGLLEGVRVVPDDGSVPAVPSGLGDLLLEVDGQFLLWPSRRSEVLPPSGGVVAPAGSAAGGPAGGSSGGLAGPDGLSAAGDAAGGGVRVIRRRRVRGLPRVSSLRERFRHVSGQAVLAGPWPSLSSGPGCVSSARPAPGSGPDCGPGAGSSADELADVRSLFSHSALEAVA